MMEGVILKGISGFYYVFSDGKTIECKAKGLFRKKGLTPLAGDRVELSLNDDGTGTVTDILPRKNSFDRPPVANIDCFVLVAAARDPMPSFLMLDRFTVACEKYGVQLIICINKTDIADDKTLTDFQNAYGGVYKVFPISASNGIGIEELKRELCGKQAALAGPSGVGKSTLTNALLGSDKTLTGEISERLMRGKNTTRHTELFAGDGFFLFDTPGFTSFDVPVENEDVLASLFPDFDRYTGSCRFSDCRHLNEPGCGLTNALNEGKISASRYESYKEMFLEIKKSREY